MTEPRSKREPLLVGAVGAVVAALFIALFRFRRIGPLDFWAWLAANIVVALVLAFAVDRGYARMLEDRLSVEGIDVIMFPPWLVAYLLVAFPCVSLFRRVLAIY